MVSLGILAGSLPRTIGTRYRSPAVGGLAGGFHAIGAPLSTTMMSKVPAKTLSDVNAAAAAYRLWRIIFLLLVLPGAWAAFASADRRCGG